MAALSTVVYSSACERKKPVKTAPPPLLPWAPGDSQDLEHKGSEVKNPGVALGLESCPHKRRKLASLGHCVMLLTARSVAPFCFPRFVCNWASLSSVG